MAENVKGKSNVDRLAGWRALQSLVEAAHWMLNDATLEQVEALFLSIEQSGGAVAPVNLTSEFARDEFLLALDERGASATLSSAALEQARHLLDAYPAFRHWFSADKLPGGEPALLPARWLCHVTGFRHGTVEIFIDPPDMPGYTFAQVRGVDRLDPAMFDMPCAGHISATDTVEASLRKELSEELNLGLEAFAELRELTRYESSTQIIPIGLLKSVTKRNYNVNNEYRTLYWAKLKPSAVHHVRFADGEVAGLALFSVGALHGLIKQFPERVASGLSGAIPFYPG